MKSGLVGALEGGRGDMVWVLALQYIECYFTALALSFSLLAHPWHAFAHMVRDWRLISLSS